MPARRLPLVHLYAVALLTLGLVVPSDPGFAQLLPSADDSLETGRYGNGAGFQILLTNNGFGLGGYYSRQLSPAASFVLDMNLGAGKDEQELKFYRFGSGVIPDKYNYFLMLPVQAGMQRRLFQNVIEDNFRPYLHVTAGPTMGWEYPYFEDANGNQRFDEDIDRTYDVFEAFPKGHVRFGVGGTIAFGAYFGLSRRVTQGVRFGYSLTYFFEGIQLIEPDVKAARHVFGTPVISIVFGRVF